MSVKSKHGAGDVRQLAVGVEQAVEAAYENAELALLGLSRAEARRDNCLKNFLFQAFQYVDAGKNSPAYKATDPFKKFALAAENFFSLARQQAREVLLLNEPELPEQPFAAAAAAYAQAEAAVAQALSEQAAAIDAVPRGIPACIGTAPPGAGAAAQPSA